MLNDKEHWDTFYRDWKLAIPSQFCSMTALDLMPGDQVIEFGCGNGRDATCFAMFGANVLAFDASPAAIEQASGMASQHQGLKLKFAECDVADGEKLASIIKGWQSGARTLFYARFFFHSIDDAREATLLKVLRDVMKPSDRCYLEFRTLADKEGLKEFGQHFRRYVRVETLCETLRALGFEVVYQIEGQGMAVFRGEDAVVGRLIFQKAET